ncbi:3-oxoadipate enol-lactonase/4-carboxymuconolactone decarboxylase [Streptomyces lydicamycinicus]|uniref:3-oxoadipate enol-lactonase/4-carboxymuconolactone decarboxylase n=2 Tax=Streptomyces lydicamycinicus TaxID=1546107 RepID=A0A0P4RGP9_9ACTN|nr:3-oxoadipate enol-lactonase/4-carboxymuconolactone decarboxylase [Streptomyces lydicamycinicus]
MWDRQIPELTRHWRVIRFDLPGHGGSPAHAAPSVAELADRLIATLDALGVDRFGYAGCNIGGAIGTQLALTRPHQVTSLALVSTSPRYGTADAWRQRGVVIRTNGLDPIARTAPEHWFTQGFAGAQPAIVEWAVQMVRTTDPGCYIAACEALASYDVRSSLGRVGVPTLVVVGSEDQVTPTTDARSLVAGIPDASLALVPGTSHLVPVEQPAAVTELLIRHFSTAWHDKPGPGGQTALGAAAPKPQLAPPPPPQAPPAAIESGLAQPEQARGATYEAGIKVRREVLGDAHVDRVEAATDDFTGDFHDFITRYAWGETWTRPGLDRRTRSIITLTALVARGHHDELVLHVRAALRNGLTPTEIKEVLLHTAIYCGVPAANSAFAVAQRVIREETTPEA